MGTPYLSEIRIVSFNFAPRGWALCNGQTLSINQNQALFSLLGTTYGGDGITNFKLPNLQASMPLHQGNGFNLGMAGGEAAHTLTVPEMPSHTHTAQGVSTAATSPTATNNTWATSTANPYNTQPPPNTTLNPATVAMAGGGQPHDNMPPYLTLNFVIALQGIFPTRN
jgi:microcystin-dependent protein